VNSAVNLLAVTTSPVAGRRTVVVLAKYYYPYNGGIENSTRVFCEGLAREYRVRVIAFNHEPGFSHETIGGVEVERYPTLAVVKSQPVSLRYLWAALRTSADITHFHAPNVLASLALAIRKPRRLIVVHHMDIYGRPQLRRIARALYDVVLRRSNLLVVTSKKNVAVSGDLRVTVPTRAVPLGIDPALYAFTPQQRLEAGKWRNSIAGNAPLVGFVGRHARYKGIHVLLHALVQLPLVHAVIGGDGPFRTAAEELSRSLGIDDRVYFLGEISHVKKLQLLSTIDVYAFPSTEITEAFGISQLEAMIMGAAVVASDLPTGVADVSVHEETALTVPPGDASAFAEAVKRLLQDSVLRGALTRRAHARVLSEFTTDIMVDRFNKLNDKLLVDG
jgi:glycosyltransferase involved in cell wall biosynthesis